MSVAGDYGKSPRIDVTLRTPHVEFLAYIAERDDTSQSQAFGAIIEMQAQAMTPRPLRPTKKARKHLVVSEEHRSLLNQLSERWGVSIAEVSRRLIDGALARYPRTSG